MSAASGMAEKEEDAKRKRFSSAEKLQWLKLRKIER